MKTGFKETGTAESTHKWYTEYPKAEKPSKHSKSEIEVLDLKDEGKKHLDGETAAFQLKQSKTRDSETMWLRTALTQGTTSDKVAASIVLIQDNPKYNLSRLTSLVSQVRAAKHNQCGLIITSLRDLFLSDLLHPEFKLLKFEEQDLNDVDRINSSDMMNKASVRKKLLAHWYFEDQLREHYERFITSVAAIASDTVDANREKAISIMTDLLMGNAEQEHKLLELIVNKIGDPSGKVGSKTVFCLNKLLREHPNMKLVVLREVEKLLFRKNVSQRAQYYAICLLTQFVLNQNDEEISATLIETYFAFFKACLKKGEPDSRMMGAILTGVNRAYPFAKMDTNILNDHIDSVFKVVHLGTFNVSLNALSLLFQVTGKNETQANRFYSAFYRKLLDPQIGVVNKRAMFLHLLFKVLQNDSSVQRLAAFIKRILQVIAYFPANMTCATLYVVSKVLHNRKDLKNILMKEQSYIKTELEDNENQDISICTSTSNTRERLDTVTIDEEIEIKEETEEDSIMLPNITIIPAADSETKFDIKEEDDKKVDINSEKKYDPYCRNPLYAGAARSCIIELLALSNHFHPSVALFANIIIQGQSIDYTGDPLEDLTLIRFLDRYVFKNPKKLESKKVQKKNDPLARRTGYTPGGVRSLAVDSPAYLSEAEERIPADELYLYHYLKRKELRHKADQTEDDVESVNSEEFNDMLDRLGGSKDLEDIDVAADIGSIKKRKDIEDEDDLDDNESIDSGGSSDIDDDLGSRDEDILNDDDDEELADLSDIDFENIDDEDLSDIDFNDDSDEDLQKSKSNLKNQVHKKTSRKSDKSNKKIKKFDDNIFVSAEKFAEMLEEQSRTKGKHGGTETYSSLDGASSKQIDWEIKRNQRLKGSFKKNKRKGPNMSKNRNTKKFKR